MSFFPQLVAGPIERSESLLPQINEIEKLNIYDFGCVKKGAFLMIWGYFIKMIIADRLSYWKIWNSKPFRRQIV